MIALMPTAKLVGQYLSDSNKRIEWAGCIFGLVGAYVLAQNDAVSKWAYVLWIISNGLLIIFALRAKLYGVLVMQIGFTYTSLLGVSNWLLK